MKRLVSRDRKKSAAEFSCVRRIEKTGGFQVYGFGSGATNDTSWRLVPHSDGNGTRGKQTDWSVTDISWRK